MSRKYFGTDGIRGQANTHPMTAEMALKVAMATAVAMKRGEHKHRVVIGKDTRLSGYMLEQAMASGFVAMGMEVVLLGPLPTPAVANLTRSLRADVGVMISASHNPYQDNGIKLFGPDGFKPDDDMELRIEALIDSDLNAHLPPPSKIGKATRLDDAQGRYVEFLKNTFPKGQSLSGKKIVIDCAHGAAYKTAPQVLWELEADVVAIGVQPNGININDGCGATDTAQLQKRVVEEGADFGIALDGDADRLILVDEKGNRVDGDQLMALIAGEWIAQGRLKQDTLVATVMSNLGLERYIAGLGGAFKRTPVGDRYVVEHMRAHDCNLGGEQSGHLILSDYATTGDGLLSALQVLAIVTARGIPASEACRVFKPLPQILKNVRFDKSFRPLETDAVRNAIANAEKTLANDGRLLVRPSGTEPVIRVMAEGDDSVLIERVVNDICGIIEKVAN